MHGFFSTIGWFPNFKKLFSLSLRPGFGALRASPEVGAALLAKEFQRACEVIVCRMHEATWFATELQGVG